jgi:hypothetical protein
VQFFRNLALWLDDHLGEDRLVVALLFLCLLSLLFLKTGLLLLPPCLVFGRELLETIESIDLKQIMVELLRPFVVLFPSSERVFP